MKLGVPELKFQLSENPFGLFPKKLDSLSEGLKSLRENAGTCSEKFNKAYSTVLSAIKSNQDLSNIINEPIKVRALAVSLQSDFKENVRLTEDVFKKIDQIKSNPSSLLIQSIYQHYLSYYDQLEYPLVVSRWLNTALKKKGQIKYFHKYILSENGPKWLAKQCVENNREFSNELAHLNLENYATGRFLSLAKLIYFVEKLGTIPVNQQHPLLLELQHKSVIDDRYDEHFLLGHKVLQILIERAPHSKIDDSWLNVILNIAGDPRVPTTHPKYQKWWSALDPSLNTKVRGWLSRLDLRLFLEALENYSSQPGHKDLKRMFPSRKRFLEGLLKKELITHTRLYLSLGAATYLRENYRPEHLPNYSTIIDQDKSIIHVQMGSVHMIEGSYSCFLWIYPELDPSAIVFNYSETQVTYTSLTKYLSLKMREKGTPHRDNITHNPHNFNWQHKALITLNSMGVNITSRDVLSEEDYSRYKRRYGVSYGY